ncbi:MAG: NAD(P)-binding domain-containing protein [Actinomycetota bacterium]
MPTTSVVIMGGGQAGLAMSHHLAARSIDHVILEKGAVANAWKTERWDALRLLTPNWLSRLPGYHYRGDDPNGFMTAAEVVDYLEGYRTTIEAPVLTGTTVRSVTPTGGRHRIGTDDATWTADAVVMATGAARDPKIPDLAAALPPSVEQLDPLRYRNPDQIDGRGRVVVVGASASGSQIANELAIAGHDVVLAVGSHTRLPRTYRGLDIHWWLHTLGVLEEPWHQIDDLAKARRRPSLQLIGTRERRDLGLNELAANGVELVGRWAGVADGKAQFAGSLANVCADADLKERRLLDRIDAHAAAHGLDAELEPPVRPAPTAVPPTTNHIDLATVSTVIWATGFRPRYPWLDPAHLDRAGNLVHDGGVLAHPGLYVLGLPFARTRKSNFIDGVGPDAAHLAAHLHRHLDAGTRNVPAAAMAA